MTRQSDPVRRARLYDWWSRHPGALGWLYRFAFMGRGAELRRRSIEALDPTPGERIIEIGCGRGNAFPAIREHLTTTGSIVGLDASGGMVEAATRRVRDRGWANVHVVRGDARRPPFAAGAFDGAYAAMSLSAVGDPEAAIEATRDQLRPDGRFVVLDARPFEWLPLRPLNRAVVPIAEFATNWVPEVDFVAVIRREFAAVEVTEFNAGSIVIVRAQTRG